VNLCYDHMTLRLSVIHSVLISVASFFSQVDDAERERERLIRDKVEQLRNAAPVIQTGGGKLQSSYVYISLIDWITSCSV